MATKQVLIPRRSRLNTYIACEDIDFTWCTTEVRLFDELWQQGLSIVVIANKLEREVDEVVMLVIDRARVGAIDCRTGGIFGLLNS